MVFLDGGFGTMVQAAGLPVGKDPTDWNLENPEAVRSVHRAYVEAGAEIVLTNTFGANRLKYHGTNALADLIAAAVRNARDCSPRPHRVALDLGPTGKLLKPAGDLDFAEAVAAFGETVRLGAAAGADLVFVETMGDTRELKAAVLAAKENCPLPVYATVALGEDGRLLTGGSVEEVALILEGLGVEAYGLNCGLGPDRMLPFVRSLARVSTRPIIVKPNAGMPRLKDGQTVFNIGPEAFADHVRELEAAGATIVGGCCGTTPDHIRAVVKAGAAERTAGALAPRAPQVRTAVASGTQSVELRPHAGLIIGERINPTGKKKLKAAYLSGDTAYILREAVKQVDAGAKILDLNCGVPGIDEATTLESTLVAVESVVSVPLQIDTADPVALERALRRVNGKALVNSVNGKRESMAAVFPLVKKYGGVIVALCLDEEGIPSSVEGRLEIARKILAEGRQYGFAESDFVFDALTLSVSTDPQAAVVTLETVRRLTDELKVNTVLGVSNVSFGLPNRSALNNAMYALARQAGLSVAIANPETIRDEVTPAAAAVLLGRDANCAEWIAANAAGAMPVEPTIAPAAHDHAGALKAAIRSGLKADAATVAGDWLGAGAAAMTVVTDGIVPALEEVGRGFERGTVYLPQLLMAADAAGAAFEAVKRTLPEDKSSARANERPIVLATVKGDIHDIGKNIVRALLENYSFNVIDLGRDVPPERIVEVARESGAMLVGLSALMTTTVGAMAETIRQLKVAGLACRTVVGGAVVTQDFADQIGADFYAADAMRTVRIAESL